jgi:hypothetical protein
LLLPAHRLTVKPANIHFVELSKAKDNPEADLAILLRLRRPRFRVWWRWALSQLRRKKGRG